MRKIFTVLSCLALFSCANSESNIDSELLGIWATECDTSNSGGSAQDVIEFTSDAMYYSDRYFLDSECSDPSYTRTAKFDLKVDGSNGEGNIDFQAVSATITPYSVEEKEQLETYLEISITLGEEVDVTEKYSGLREFRMRYDIYKIVDGNLFFGKTTDLYDASTPEARPIEIADGIDDSVFIKQEN